MKKKASGKSGSNSGTNHHHAPGFFESAYNTITSAWFSSAQRAGCMELPVVGDDVGTEVTDPEHGVIQMNSGELWRRFPPPHGRAGS